MSTSWIIFTFQSLWPMCLISVTKTQRHFFTRQMFLHFVKSPKGPSKSNSIKQVLQITALTFHTHQSIFPMALFWKQNIYHQLRPAHSSSYVCNFSHRNAHNVVLWLVHKTDWMDVFLKHSIRPNAKRSNLQLPKSYEICQSHDHFETKSEQQECSNLSSRSFFLASSSISSFTNYADK